ncbi:hypothetical protein AB205_0043120 [Aquarana catesbeiana]|uniref:Uncharacterized protein n=1 Tax=Aquarana catesbeiana TaxID=8400 RepID=A0A2G9RTH1_AQUCT|nr:hypothetical protein AB205_0043120 [Aquarana catesbeiana]
MHASYALYTLRMRETPPAPDVLSSLFPAPSSSAQWGKSTWWRHNRCVLITATRRRRRKARSLKHHNPEGDDLRHQICPWRDVGDGQHTEKDRLWWEVWTLPQPQCQKGQEWSKVVKSLQNNFGIRGSKDQLRKRWSDLKLREHKQYRRIRRVLQKRK